MWANIAPTRSNQTEEAREADQTVGAGHPPIRRNLVKQIGAVNSERQGKEDDVVDNPPGEKLERHPG